MAATNTAAPASGDGPSPVAAAAPVVAPDAGARPAATDAPSTPCKENAGWRKIVRNFTPSWFSVTMGTGIVSVLLHNLPYSAAWVRCIATAVFCLNVGLFAAFAGITAVRYVLYPEIWGVMIKHPAQSLFLGCIPMGLATIVNMIVLVCAPWGPWAVYLAWALWWLDAIAACACSLTIPFVIVHHHHNQLSTITAALLLPVVPVIVASASGGIVASALPDARHTATTLVASYILWGLGQAFACMILVVYFLRLQLHDLPPRAVIVSVFLPVGPMGQGGFAILQLGKVAARQLAGTEHATAGVVLETVGFLGALLQWGAGLGWLAFALFSVLSTKSFPFNMGWWGFTFPLGVFAACTGLLAEELSSGFFRVLTMIFSLSVLSLWVVVASKTLIMAFTGEMFYAPCLKDLRPKEQQGGQDRTV